MEENYTLFESPVGSIGLIWTPLGISGLLLPERNLRATKQTLHARYPNARAKAPPPAIKKAVKQIQNLLAGKPATLDSITLDLSGVSPFYQLVYAIARAIPPGQTQSYGEVARALGKKGAARAVGQALGRNPIALIIPCHRVLAQNGSIGGFSAPGGTTTKARLLELERELRAAKIPTPPPAPRNALRVRKMERKTEHAAAQLIAVKAKKAELGEGARFLHKLEPKFRAVIDRASPMRPGSRKKADVFTAFAKAITHQQLSGKAAASIWARVSALGGGALTAEFVATAPLSVLRSAGLSEAKALSIKDLGARILAGTIPERRALAKMTDEDIVATMTTVRGVGRWTVEMFLIFDLGRPDVLSTGDYGVRKGYSVVFGSAELPTPKELAHYGQRWAPHRTAATWYLWRALEPGP